LVFNTFICVLCQMYFLFKSVSRKCALNLAGSHPQFFVDYTPAWFSHFMLPNHYFRDQSFYLAITGIISY
jgi:hypothetical protein